MPGPALVDVPVPGGDLAVATSGAAPRSARVAVLLVHGLTASHRTWSLVAPRLPADVAVVAVDLRGRGASEQLGGPYGLAAHAADCAGALDFLGAERAVVVGHGAGAAVATTLAARLPARVLAAVLLDGGVPVPAPPGAGPEAALAAALGPALARLERPFPSRDEHRRWWRQHPALAGAWCDAVERYVDYDLGGAPPALRCRVAADAVRADAVELLGGGVAGALGAVGCPVELLLAERGVLDQPPPVVPLPAAEAARALNPRLRVTTVPGVNHYTITLSPHGADAVAAAVARGVAAAGR